MAKNEKRWVITYCIRANLPYSGSLNSVNLKRSRNTRLKWDIDKLKYEKWSKYRFKQPKLEFGDA